mgnify:FL=1|jgi:hypothetical protein
MMKQRIGLASSPDCHHQRIHDQWRIPIGPHGSADDPARKRIKHNGDVGQAFPGPDVGEIGQPLLVRLIGLEGAVQNVDGDHRPFTIALRLSMALGPLPFAEAEVGGDDGTGPSVKLAQKV